MINRFSYFFFLFLFLPLATIYSAELDDLEARIDQMLERLNKVESSNTKRPIAEPLTQEDVGMETEMGLPSISLPSLPPEKSNPSNSEASQALEQLDGRIDNLLRRLNMESSPLVEAQTQVTKQVQASNPKPQKLPESENPPNSFALPVDLGEQNFDPLPSQKTDSIFIWV